jgi:flagellar biosynthesis/type III secretory pathway protein FliH
MLRELSEKDQRDRAEYRRLVDEEFERKKRTGFKNGEETTLDRGTAWVAFRENSPNGLVLLAA